MITNISASSVTLLSSTYLHDPNYIPSQYFLLLVIMGFVCWFLLSYNKELEIIFSLISVIAFGAAAWFAAYITTEASAITVIDGVPTTVYAQVVVPQPGIQIIMVVCFLFSIVITVYVWMLRDMDKKTDAQSLMKRGQV